MHTSICPQFKKCLFGYMTTCSIWSKLHQLYSSSSTTRTMSLYDQLKVHKLFYQSMWYDLCQSETKTLANRCYLDCFYFRKDGWTITRYWGGKNLGMNMPQSRMEYLTDKSESNTTKIFVEFNNSQWTQGRKVSQCILQNLRCEIWPSPKVVVTRIHN